MTCPWWIILPALVGAPVLALVVGFLLLTLLRGEWRR